MKRAILVVAFGTTVDAGRQQNIDPVVKKIEEAFPDYDVFSAFTSRIVVKRLRDRGVLIRTEEGMMEELIAAGYEEIVAQPLHLIGGEEYEKLKQNMLSYAGQGGCHRVAVGRPLLYFSGQENRPDDYGRFIDAFVRSFPRAEGEGLVLVGHGGDNAGNASYAVLQMKLWQAGLKEVRVITLESFPQLTDSVVPWTGSGMGVGESGQPPARLHLHPLLLVAGDHVLNDIFSEDEDSIVNRLHSSGQAQELIEYRAGLGAYEAIQLIYADHVKDAVSGCYDRRSSRRPAIPVIK